MVHVYTRLRIALPLGLLLLSTIACGGFQIRVTPAAKPTTPPRPTMIPAVPARPFTPTPEPTLVLPTPRPTVVPTLTPLPSTAEMAPGKSARVTASGGLRVREKPSTSAQAVGKLGPGAIVILRNGPVAADGYTWWEVDDGLGVVGWVAAGTPTDPWLSAERGSGPAAQGGKLVNRAVRLGDRVQVTTSQGQLLTVREAAGKDSPAVARVKPNTQFIVRGGPIRQDGLLWWQLEGEEIRGWAAEGEGTDRWLTPVEP